MPTFFCYRNLHKHGVVYSMRSVKTKRVEKYSSEIVLKTVQLKVGKAGNARVRLTRQKNVHAGVQGTEIKKAPAGLTWRKARYNPYEFTTFVDAETEQPVKHADYIILNENGLMYSMTNWSKENEISKTS